MQYIADLSIFEVGRLVGTLGSAVYCLPSAWMQYTELICMLIGLSSMRILVCTPVVVPHLVFPQHPR